MATENKSKTSNQDKSNKRRKHYLPHNKPVKKGAYPLRAGVEGFFITCDGGRERQAAHEAINVIDSFYEELVGSAEPKVLRAELSPKPLNKITKFTDSDSSSGDDNSDNEGRNVDHPTNGHDGQTEEDVNKPVISKNIDAKPQNEAGLSLQKTTQDNDNYDNHGNGEAQALEPPSKKQCIEANAPDCGKGFSKKVEEKSIDELIDAEIAELGDRNKKRFSKLDSGCNGVVFVQMRKKDGDPSPKDIVQHMMTSLAASKKQVSRFLLRVLPIEVTCYTSDEEIRRAIKPVIDKYFPVETETPHKFAVLYDARANTGIDRTKIIDVVAKCVPAPHKVDLGNPDINIVVQIVKTVCLIGIVEKYKELAKYNLRQLTSSDN